ncbi:MAG: hypothetical protein E6Q68_06040 [Polynucleobacter sp.]|nr:MAG: hypothetical protein E6Q68_06040 [Polynucleobacter sp.]
MANNELKEVTPLKIDDMMYSEALQIIVNRAKKELSYENKLKTLINELQERRDTLNRHYAANGHKDTGSVISIQTTEISRCIVLLEKILKP